ncbi:Putative enoyl-CoA hydratase/isomerase [Mycobacteroides abscessus]|nr:Putative enoyl-CoA hydratase/isomerase [Mycobacteroides abscessus]SKU14936.1 enoyl-CoA hydratase [Mycobacteroides abscessus subsp. abscessus]SKU70331.1 enoyl-CoA hydratase [Mycobacteroides abscessus subsp. abscessus]
MFDTPEATLAAAHATAAEIAANPPLVVQGVKDVLGRERENVVADGLKYVSTWNAAFLPSEDLQEAIGAVFEKREPDFKGR